MKKLFCLLLSFASLAGFGQSESHNFITYDTTYNVGYANLSYILHISRPANGDTASRPALIFMAGVGQVGTNIASSLASGPHYFMSTGWDGGIQLGNGKHYPIIITVQPNFAWPQTNELVNLLKYILNTYHIKRNSVHLTGFSMGSMAWTALICHQNSPGGEDGMKLVSSICALEGVSNQISAGQQPYQLGGKTSWTSFGQWAKKYGGKFFGLEGTADYRGLWQVQRSMNDSAAGSAYTQFQNIGGGIHCCWNSMYDPAVIDWTATNANIQPNTNYPGTLGTYFKGENIFQWMLRQGDTTLVAASKPNQPPVAVATAQTITLPVNSVTLDCNGSYDPDGGIASCSWSLITGPTHPTWGGPIVSDLVAGVYAFRLTVTDNQGATSTAITTVTVNPAPKTISKITITYSDGSQISFP